MTAPEQIRLKRLFASSVGGSWGNPPEEEGIAVPCVRGTDLDFQRLQVDLTSAPMRSYSAAEIQYRGAAAGDIIIEKSGGGENQPVGRVGLYGGLSTVMPTNFAGRLRPRSDQDPRYLTYLLAAQYFAGRTRAAIKQTTGIQNLEVEVLLATRVPRFPQMKQRAIADYLDTETARIDALLTKKRRMIQLLEKRWRAEAEHRMHALSLDFGSIALKRVVQCLDGKRIPLSGEERSQRQGEYRYYGASGAIDSIDGYLFDETLVLLGEDGAQLADPDYEIAFAVRGKVWVNNHAHVLRPIRANPDFLAFHLSTLDRGMFISGATREKITQADMNEIPVPDMPLEAQAGIASELLAGRARCEATAAALRKQIDLLAEHRQALITAAVTGNLDVSKAA